MKPRSFLFVLTIIFSFILISCGSNTDSAANDEPADTKKTDTASTSNTSTATNEKGIGKFQNVELTHPLDEKMIASGKTVYDLKCASCHKLSEEKLVGPGWKGVTDRRTPEWIMNFVTNTEEMLGKDPTAKNLYEVCLVKMPNQNLKDDEARNVLEYMRNNDGKK
jgi:hypothetical protein